MPFARFKWLSSPSTGPDRPPVHEARLLLIAAAVNAALFAAVLASLTLSYETNDDVGMANIASGLLSGTPSADLVFTNFLIGSGLTHLYQWADGVNWYTFYILAAHFAAMTGLLYGFLRIRFSLMSIALFVLLFLEYEVGLLLWLQYTSVAIMAAVAGCLLLTSPVRNAGRSALATAYGGCLILLAGLIRSDGLFFALLAIAPFVAYRLLSGRRGRPLLRLGACVGIVLAAMALNEWHYRGDPRWREYRIVNAGLAPVLDTKSIDYNEETRPFFDSLGWSESDWRMLRSWFFADPEVYSTSRIEKMAAHFRESGWRRPHAWGYLENRFSPLSVFERMTYANMLLAFLLCGGLRMRLILLGGFQGLWVLSLFFLLALYSKIEPRLAMPAAFALGVIVFDLALQTARERSTTPQTAPRSALARSVLAVGLLAVCLFYGWAFYRTARRNWTISEFNRRSHSAYRSFVEKVIDRYVEPDPDAIFFNFGASFPFQFTPPFDTNRQIARLRMVSLGWSQHSPLFDERLRTLGLSNLAQAMCGNPHVYFFMPPAAIEPLERFVKKHYHQDIVPKRIDVMAVGDGADADRDDLVVHVVQMTSHAKSHAHAPGRPAP